MNPRKTTVSTDRTGVYYYGLCSLIDKYAVQVIEHFRAHGAPWTSICPHAISERKKVKITKDTRTNKVVRREYVYVDGEVVDASALHEFCADPVQRFAFSGIAGHARFLMKLGHRTMYLIDPHNTKPPRAFTKLVEQVARQGFDLVFVEHKAAEQKFEASCAAVTLARMIFTAWKMRKGNTTGWRELLSKPVPCAFARLVAGVLAIYVKPGKLKDSVRERALRKQDDSRLGKFWKARQKYIRKHPTMQPVDSIDALEVHAFPYSYLKSFKKHPSAVYARAFGLTTELFKRLVQNTSD